MKGMFVNEDEFPYAQAIGMKRKLIETRSRDMLKKLVGERVAIIRTKRGEKPLVIGTVFLSTKWYEEHPWQFSDLTQIHANSKYNTGAGRWMYVCEDAKMLDPEKWIPLPENAVRHGRSWAEW